MLRIFVGTGCRQSLWPDSDHAWSRRIAAVRAQTSRHPLPKQRCVDDLDDPRRYGGTCDPGARVFPRLVSVEQVHALRCIPIKRGYLTIDLNLLLFAPAG